MPIVSFYFGQKEGDVKLKTSTGDDTQKTLNVVAELLAPREMNINKGEEDEMYDDDDSYYDD